MNNILQNLIRDQQDWEDKANIFSKWRLLGIFLGMAIIRNILQMFQGGKRVKQSYAESLSTCNFFMTVSN